jgi:hypothetical protein
MATEGRSLPVGEICPLTPAQVQTDERLLAALELLAAWTIACEGKEEDFLVICKDAFGYAQAYKDDHIRDLRCKQACDRNEVADFHHSLEKVAEDLLRDFCRYEMGRWDWDLGDTVAYLKTLTIHPEQIDTVDKRVDMATEIYNRFADEELTEAKAMGDTERIEMLT